MAAAPVSLACCPSGYPKLCGDFGLADPEADGAVDERVKFCLCCVARTVAFDGLNPRRTIELDASHASLASQPAAIDDLIDEAAASLT